MVSQMGTRGMTRHQSACVAKTRKSKTRSHFLSIGNECNLNLPIGLRTSVFGLGVFGLAHGLAVPRNNSVFSVLPFQVILRSSVFAYGLGTDLFPIEKSAI